MRQAFSAIFPNCPGGLGDEVIEERCLGAKDFSTPVGVTNEAV